MKRILFLAQSYYPSSVSGANILRKICESLTDTCLVDVYTLSCGNDDSKHEVIQKVNVYRACSEMNADKICSICGKAVSVLNGVYSFNIMKLKQCQNEFENRLKEINYDLVVSVCYPIAAHYIASQARRKKKNFHFKWIAYYLDPYFCNKQLGKGYKRRFYTEKRILNHADAVIVPGLIKADYAQIKHNCLYDAELPNIIDFSKTKKEKSVSLDSENIKCVFLGNLYGDIRNPESLFKMIDYMDDTEIKFYFVGGKYNFQAGFLDMWKKRLGKKIEMINRVSAESANWILEQADILINIGNSVDNQLPGKVFDYISVGKPIVNICKMKNCPSLQFLKYYPLALSLFEGGNSCASQDSDRIKKFIYENRGKRISYSEICKLYREFTSAHILAKIDKIFKQVIGTES